MEQNRSKIEGEAGYQALFESSTIGILVINSKGRIKVVNSCIEKLFGYSNTELIGQTVENLIPGSFKEHLTHPPQVHAPEHTSRPLGYGLNLFARKKDGFGFPVEIIIDYRPEIPNEIIIIIIDINKRKELGHSLKKINEELEDKVKERTLVMSQTVKILAKMVSETEEKELELKKLNSFLQNIWHDVETMVFVTDIDGIIKMFNPYAEKNLGYTADEVVEKKTPDLFFDGEELKQKAKDLSEAFHTEISSGFTFYRTIIELGHSNEYDVTFVRKNGSKFPVLFTFNKMINSNGNGETMGYTFIAKDISERKKIENELVKAYEKEKELSELRNKYLSLASHEFRTPLSVILSSAFIISKYQKTEDQPKREEHIKHITSSVNLLRDILNDFLSLSKIQEGKIKLRNVYFNPKTHIKEIIDELSGLLKKGQTMDYRHSGDTNLYLDAGMLKHILINLLSNAIKFSPEFTKILVYSKKVDHKFELVIKDHGCGISPEDQTQLFSRFFRGSNASKVQGTGLGLHIVGLYLEKMKGTLKIKSKLDSGTIIRLEFNEFERKNNSSIG